MSRRKLHRFQHNQEAVNVIEGGKPLYTTIKGKWNELHFEKAQPLVLELACGKGEYTVGLAENIPDKNFIGIDIKGDRIARGSKRALDKGLTNASFLRTGIQYLDEFFEDKEVDEIWLIHPDPQPSEKQEKKRLTNQHFLNLYKKYLRKDGLFRLKTDSPFLYEYSLEMLKNDPDFEVLTYTNDLYNSPLLEEHYGIQTHYEQLWVEKGYTINYITARLKV
ncbi:tRNA (guanosine(46)-N7)-methyltransferase TrmB [Arcticibacterium luteifluviistationis]|uniref:tRNA (guanine-N(7)-)-methyltransferase n=1 Tax=Arcticibacterium luteifluviistationis TaxID=1784714 RepID=A0A2Z4G6T3_9BACT|nr:tRNA (guanosine(46)-N7)-methyltransferase TrmB [Arcticibacterium luteifluviistationis]AWV96867.1 tRNA (guanosine(46)-N7)-methyltransferase TrmB [Arcticibacterium luteifluviistationis]